MFPSRDYCLLICQSAHYLATSHPAPNLPTSQILQLVMPPRAAPPGPPASRRLSPPLQPHTPAVLCCPCARSQCPCDRSDMVLLSLPWLPSPQPLSLSLASPPISLPGFPRLILSVAALVPTTRSCCVCVGTSVAPSLQEHLAECSSRSYICSCLFLHSFIQP